MTQVETQTCCSASDASSNETPAAAGVTHIDCATVKQWLDAGDAVLVDVREPVEHAGLAIPGATLVPLGKISKDALPDHAGKRLVLHCKAGGRSKQACEKLAAAGLEVFSMTGGIDAWNAAGLPVRKNDKAPLDLVRQVHIVVGSMVLLFSILAAATGSLWFLIVPIFFGGGLLFAGATGFCGLALMLSKMPWNRV